MDPQDEGWRRNNVGRLLNVALARFENRIFELLHERGHSQVRISQLSLTRNLDLAGTSTTELARRANMTKQAMSEIVTQCVATGLVYRIPDPKDARAKIILFTDAGLAWLDAFKDALRHAEQEMRQKVGTTAQAQLVRALARYDDIAIEGDPSDI